MSITRWSVGDTTAAPARPSTCSCTLGRFLPRSMSIRVSAWAEGTANEQTEMPDMRASISEVFVWACGKWVPVTL